MIGRARRGTLFACAVALGAIACGGGASTPPPDTTPPSTPGGLGATAVSSGQIDLSWNPSTDGGGIAGYGVYRDGGLVWIAMGTAFSDTGLAAATRHCYRVTARDQAANESAFSPEACATTFAPDTTPPGPPPDLVTSTVSGSRIDLSWGAATDDVGVTGYRVKRDGAMVASTAARSWSDTGLLASVRYCYTVTAVDAAGNEGSPSAESCAETLPHRVWTRLLGTSAMDRARGVAIDAAGNVLVAGFTYGVLDPSALGSADALLVKYDRDGTRLWTRQLGSAANDWGLAVAVDAAGNAFVAGQTEGGVDGPSAGQSDAFLAKVDPAGTTLWARQLGTGGYDIAYGVAVDASGHAFVAGITQGALQGPSAGQEDAFVAKYDADGTLRWVRQLGTSGGDWAYAVAASADGYVYVTGETYGTLPGASSAGDGDVFLLKLDPDGATSWIRQVGTPVADTGTGVAVDRDGNVVVVGHTGSWTPCFGILGNPCAAGTDTFLLRYDPAGALLWSTQLGSNGNDNGFAVAVDGAGTVYAAGYTDGALGGQANAGGFDGFLARYEAGGAQAWTVLHGTAGFDTVYGAAVDPWGDVVVVGGTPGSLDGQANAGNDDLYVVKWRP
jgi:hypothetical protein